MLEVDCSFGQQLTLSLAFTKEQFDDFDLADLVYVEKPSPRTDQEKVQRAQELWNCLKGVSPSLLCQVIGNENTVEGIRAIYTCLQQPKLNKQVRNPRSFSIA